MHYFFRYLTKKINQRFKDNQIIILIGSRQVGKTNIAKNFFTNYLKLDAKKFYFDFEKSGDLEIWQNIDYLERYLSQHKLSLNNKLFFAIDEFQYLKNATKIFKLIYDQYPQIKILATGSSSIEIQKHLKESLTGRKKVYQVYPLNLEEYILATDRKNIFHKINCETALPSQANKINQVVLSDYLLWGGYPRLAEKKSASREIKKEELSDIYSSYIQKDIKALIGGENILTFNNLVKILASQIGNLLNVNELSKTLRISRYEIEKYLNILEQTYIIKRVPAYFKNKRKEITKMPKLFFYDLGLVNMAMSNFSNIDNRPNLGAILENFVHNQLRYFMSITDELFFWRTLEGAEVDLIWKRDDGLLPIEVKWNSFTEPKIPVNLKNCCKKFKANKAWVITKDYSNVIKEKRIEYTFIPACMLMKKIILIFAITLLITGCADNNSNQNINIVNSSVNQKDPYYCEQDSDCAHACMLINENYDTADSVSGRGECFNKKYYQNIRTQMKQVEFLGTEYKRLRDIINNLTKNSCCACDVIGECTTCACENNKCTNHGTGDVSC